MNTITVTWKIERYKFWERISHISPDDVLNKTTQEVVELLQAIDLWDREEIYAEAGDVVVNIISFAKEVGCDMKDIFSSDSWEPWEILDIFWAWNEQVQALRGRYSRKQGSLWEVESLTKTFIFTLLNYTDPDKNLTEIIENNKNKLRDRRNQYKPDIDPRDYIAEYPNFPKPGINFKDISPLLANPDAFKYVCHEMAEQIRWVEKIVALDARGFIFAPTIAQILGIPWVMARKPGKLPGETVSVSYDLEYWSNTIEIQKGSIDPWQGVAIVDDLLATGGSATAAIKLVEKLGWKVLHTAFVISLDDPELQNMPSRKTLSDYNTSHILSYE